MSYINYKEVLQTIALLLFQIFCTNISAHAHDDQGLHFSHPLITDSPSPDTEIRLDYFFLDVDGEVEDEELGEEG